MSIGKYKISRFLFSFLTLHSAHPKEAAEHEGLTHLAAFGAVGKSKDDISHYIYNSIVLFSFWEKSIPIWFGIDFVASLIILFLDKMV